jgi:hypothetical protein
MNDNPYPSRYPKPTLWDSLYPTESNDYIDANLDPRECYDLGEYITHWLFVLGHNHRIRGLCDTDWGYAKRWWEEVEELRESAGEASPSEFGEYVDDGNRLVRAAQLYATISDNPDEAREKLSWRLSNDMYERRKLSNPNTTLQPRPVKWHLSATVQVTDIKEVGNCYLYELVLVDERRLKKSLPFEIEVPKDDEAELRESDENA